MEAERCVPGSVATETIDEGRVGAAAEAFKALGDPARLRLFVAINSVAPAEICVCDLPNLELSQATVSHHLRKLRDAGLVTSQRRGTWVFYRLADDDVATAVESLIQR